MNSLGEKIAHYRRKAGLTQEQLAEKCSVTAAIAPELIDLNKMLLRFKVISAKGDNVNINIPLSLAEVAVKSGLIKVDNSDVLKQIDFKQIVQLVKCGAVGKLIEVKSADGDTVEGWVE
ncbi:MAG: helix-turn-helix domain-containing protein [Clostridia bacterium]|nr:helix-turn-helix domain-containing protein [Clostridia bacterium]